MSSDRERRQWFRTLVRLRFSVLPAILPRIIVCGAFGEFVWTLDRLGLPVALPILSSIVPSVVLGLLLVFRTNTAYERFWEGRKLWGQLINTVRNLARQIWVAVEEREEGDRELKVATLRLLVAFAVATKLHLRGDPPEDPDLAALLPEPWFDKLQSMNNPPLEVAFWIGDYIQGQFERDRVNPYQLAAMFELLDRMVDVLGGCERILKTPIPLAYSIHLKQLVSIYCLALPFQLVAELGWVTGPAVTLVSFMVFGIEEIGIEIENPFGKDPNDLPLDTICRTMERNIEDLIVLAPCLRHWRETTFARPE
ncbi:bestrophin family protein [Rubidibacter lacunae]|nr:bestrophin family ion channel [Rubidibacter lacunae]